MHQHVVAVVVACNTHRKHDPKHVNNDTASSLQFDHKEKEVVEYSEAPECWIMLIVQCNKK